MSEQEAEPVKDGNVEEENLFAEEKGGDPGLKFLKEIKLTPVEEEELATLARGWIPGKRVLHQQGNGRASSFAGCSRVKLAHTMYLRGG